MTWNAPKLLSGWRLWLGTLCLLAAGGGLLSSCGIYSFSGTNIDPAVRTFSVQTV